MTKNRDTYLEACAAERERRSADDADASGQAICREYSHNLNWKDDRALIAAIPEMVAALEEIAKLRPGVWREAGITGDDCHKAPGMARAVLQKVKKP